MDLVPIISIDNVRSNLLVKLTCPICKAVDATHIAYTLQQERMVRCNSCGQWFIETDDKKSVKLTHVAS